MLRFTGKLRLAESDGYPICVTIDLDAERISIHADTIQIGEWARAATEVRGRDNGFVLRLDDEDVIITTDDDGAFAAAMGLQWAPPRLRRLMATARR